MEAEGGSIPCFVGGDRTYLAIPATSAALERLFSVAGNTISEKSSSLTDKNAEGTFPYTRISRCGDLFVTSLMSGHWAVACKFMNGRLVSCALSQVEVCFLVV